MYRCVEKLRSWTFPLLMATMLSACGGAPADSESQPSSANNKPTPDSSSSLQASSEQKSSLAPLSSSSLVSSATLSVSSSSKSSTDTYTRASRANSSTTSSAAQDTTDVTPPSTPQLQLYRLSENSTTLVWEHAIDDVAIRSYNIYRNHQLVATLDYPTRTFMDSNLTANTIYEYVITSSDTSANVSTQSEPLTIHTLTSTNPISSSSNSTVSSKSSTSAQSSSLRTSSTPISSRASSSTASRQATTLSWSHPTKRENGNFFELDEIGGYEIRFRQNSNANYTYLTLNGSKITSYSTNLIPANSTVEIAVYDTKGLFSDFVAITATP